MAMKLTASTRITPINPKFYVARRDTRWDVYPQREPAVIIAHDWNGFWGRVPETGEWFKHPASFNFVKEITEAEANDPATTLAPYREEA